MSKKDEVKVKIKNKLKMDCPLCEGTGDDPYQKPNKDIAKCRACGGNPNNWVPLIDDDGSLVVEMRANPDHGGMARRSFVLDDTLAALIEPDVDDPVDPYQKVKDKIKNGQ
jgi:hypothetical protein|tara:strand:+ start:119 stop:451 length:333 start_codon:yes stop_codon:yes gene_type:complete